MPMCWCAEPSDAAPVLLSSDIDRLVCTALQGLAKLPSDEIASIATLARLTKEVTDDLVLHAEYVQQWGVDVRSVRPTPQCQAYLDLVLEVASSDTHGTAAWIAVVAPYARLHAYIGHELHRRKQQQQATSGSTSAQPYQKWVDSTMNAGLDALAATLEGLFDTYAVLGQARSHLLLTTMPSFLSPRTRDLCV